MTTPKRSLPGSAGPRRTSSDLRRAACLPDTPLGPLGISVTAAGLARLEFLPAPQDAPPEDPSIPDSMAALTTAPLLTLAMEQIRDYLDGRRRSFDLPIDWSQMTPFQTRVLRAALAIPYGQTRTYGDLAVELGQPGSSRAVGMALGKNPLPIIIPCHRVLGNNGHLQGYSAPDGLKKKSWLLKLEGVLLFG